jgi:CRISP-associated protein Cas1
MTIVYLTKPGTTVRRKDDRLQVWYGKKRVADLRLFEVERLVLMGPIQLTTQAVGLLLDRGIDVSFLTMRGRPRGALVSASSKNVYLRLAQFDRWRDTPFRLAMAREVVVSKISSQRRLIKRHQRNHPGALEEDAPERLERLIDRAGEADDIDVLRGYEGAAAAIYFRQFGRMLSFMPFPGRKKHPSTDPVNATLSLGYVMLTNELAGLLESQGFDPFIGFFHGIRYGRQSLPLDVVEVFRQPVIDRLTLRLFNRRQLSDEDFEGGKGGLRMQPEVLKRYLEAYDEHLRSESEGSGTPTWRDRMKEQAVELRAMVMDGEALKMYTWRG